MNLTNPYKTTSNEKKELRVDVDEEDYQYLFALVPRRGLIDGVLGQLFKKFMTRVRAEIPLPHSSLEFNQKENDLLILLSYD